MNDAEFEQLRLELAEELRLAIAHNERADKLKRQLDEEIERRKDHPGADIREFRPRPSNGPTDQGSC